MSASNNVTISGRLTADPKITYTQGNNPMCIASFTLAVNRKYAKQGQQNADFIPCKAFGKTGEFVEKYFRKGTKANASGEIHTTTYTNRDGQKVNGWEINVNDIEFGESKSASQQNNQFSGGYQQNGPQNYGQQSYAPQNGYQQSYAPQNQPTQQYAPQPTPNPNDGIDGFMNIPDGIGSDELPFA